VSPETRARLLRTRGWEYVAAIEERIAAATERGETYVIDAPRAADLALIESRASTFRSLGMDALAAELDLVVDELHYYRARS
jgi:hypothetical protein